MGKFELINPVITGTFSNTYEAGSPDFAAQKFWESLTSDNKYVSGSIPRFYFSLMDMSNNELYHYSVKEKSENGRVDYSINQINVDIPRDTKNKFLKEIQKIKNNSQKGGYEDDDKKKRRRRYKDDDSSSSSSSSSSSTSSDSDDVEAVFRHIRRKKAKRPIIHWWYAPSLYDANNIFTPSFVSPISPYVQLWIPM